MGKSLLLFGLLLLLFFEERTFLHGFRSFRYPLFSLFFFLGLCLELFLELTTRSSPRIFLLLDLLITVACIFLLRLEIIIMAVLVVAVVGGIFLLDFAAGHDSQVITIDGKLLIGSRIE